MQPNNTTPFFSDFLQLKHQNPSAYWSKTTQAQMHEAYLYHGHAYFDLHKDKSP